MNCKVKFTQLYGLYSEQTEVSVRLNSEQNIFSAQHIPFFFITGVPKLKVLHATIATVLVMIS